MAELEAQCGQETDKMLGGNQSEDDDLETLDFSLPAQLPHSITKYWPSTRSWRPKSRSTTRLYFILIALSVTVILETVLLIRGDFKGFKSRAVDSSRPCQEPAIRREWRYIEKREKDAYLAAVLCLFQKRSIFPDRGSMYDDIVFVHQYSGQAGKCD